jgi:ferrous iron transport protein A
MVKNMKLSELNIGDRAEVIKIEGEGEIVRRLMDMGLLVGTKLRLRQVAPLGDPIDICMRGFYMSLRKQEAEHIIVRKYDGECEGHEERDRCRFGREP